MSAIPTGLESVSGRPVFSVVVPSFGTSPERLGRALESLRAQSFVDWEALLVDDASPEPAEAVVRRHRALSADERIRVVRLSENRGTHVARKTGVLESRGDWILFLDADDFFAPDALAALAERLRDDPPDMVRFGVRILRRSGAEAVRLPPEAAGRPGAPCLRVLFPWNAGPFAPMCSGVYRGELCRRAFAQTTDDRLVYGEDAYELFVVSSLCKGVGRLAEPLYVYDRTGAGITSGAGIGHAPDVRLERFLRTADERLRSFAETMRFAAEAGRSDRRVRAAALRCRRAALVGRLPLEVSRLRASGVPGRRIRAGLEPALRRLSRADRVLARMGIAARRLFENAGLVRRPTGRPVPPAASAARRTEPAGRLAFADVARGIAILAVVLGHQGIPAVTRFVSPFHVPLFFLLAGFFFKESLPFPAMAAKRARALLRPYLLASLAVLVSALLFRFARGEFGDVPVVAARRIVATLYGAAAVPRHLPFGLSLPGGGSRIPTIGPIWFLPSLFFGSVFLWLVVRLRPALRTPAVLLLFWAAWRSAGLFWLPLGIQPALCALLFMYAGWLFRGKTAASVFPSAFARAVLFAVAVAANAWFLAHYRSFHLVVCRFGRGVPDIATSLLSCWLLLELSRVVCLVRNPLAALLRFFGRNSLLVLCIHTIEFQTWGRLWRSVSAWFSSFGLSDVWTRNATIAVKISIVGVLALLVRWLTRRSSSRPQGGAAFGCEDGTGEDDGWIECSFPGRRVLVRHSLRKHRPELFLELLQTMRQPSVRRRTIPSGGTDAGEDSGPDAVAVVETLRERTVFRLRRGEPTVEKTVIRPYPPPFRLDPVPETPFFRGDYVWPEIRDCARASGPDAAVGFLCSFAETVFRTFPGPDQETLRADAFDALPHNAIRTVRGVRFFDLNRSLSGGVPKTWWLYRAIRIDLGEYFLRDGLDEVPCRKAYEALCIRFGLLPRFRRDSCREARFRWLSRPASLTTFGRATIPFRMFLEKCLLAVRTRKVVRSDGRSEPSAT